MKSFFSKLGACAVFAVLAFTANAQTKTFSTSAGPVKITPIYHATLRIEAGGKVIYVDPAKPANLAGMPPADLILVTDVHGDHVDMDGASIKTVSKDGTVVWAPAA